MNDIAIKALALIGAFILGAVVAIFPIASYESAHNKVALQGQQLQFDALIKQQQAATNAAVKHALDVEHDAALKIASVDQNYQTQLGAVHDKLNKALADERSGAKRLYIATQSNAATCNGTVPTVAASTSIDTDQTRTYLPGPIAERLINRASDADQIVLQLKACQDLLIEDREAVNSR